MTTEALAPRDPVLIPNSFEETISVAQMFAKSGFFQDAKDAAQAVVKILAGREAGFGPFASMTGIYVVKGRIALAANLMAAAVKRTGRYTYRVKTHSETECAIEFFERQESLGISRFTLDDAKRAGLANGDNYRNYPRNMLFARAMSNGVRWYCPDVFGGPVYTPEEIDDDPEPKPPLRPEDVTPDRDGSPPAPGATEPPGAEEKKPPSYEPMGAIHMVTELAGGRFDGKLLEGYFGAGIRTKSLLEQQKATAAEAFTAGYDRLRTDYTAGKAGAVPRGAAA
jgi:hypothetical protein